MTLNQLYLSCSNKLANGGVESPKFEATQIISHFCNATKHEILTCGDKKVDPFTEELVDTTVSRRLQFEPLQYLLGCWDFYGNTYQVGEGVLIPRSDTEILVDHCLSVLKTVPQPRILDLCSGSGCIACSIYLNSKNSVVDAVELSQQALKYLQKNNNTLCGGKLNVIKHDIITFVPENCYDLVVSNPPYLSSKEMLELQKEVQFEPAMALVADENGYFFYKHITNRYYDFIKSKGFLAFEVGYTQAKTVALLMEQRGYQNIQIVKDFSGIERVVIGQKP